MLCGVLGRVLGVRENFLAESVDQERAPVAVDCPSLGQIDPTSNFISDTSTKILGNSELLCV